jgi:Sulfatase-modifying factor enzyme 1/RES domain
MWEPKACARPTTGELFSQSVIALLVREQGWQVSLPGEFEWEKAARGHSIRTAIRGSLEWENEFNCELAHITDTSTVGCFPPNEFGLYDMLGNVWEWTGSLWGTSPIRPDRDSSAPVGEDLANTPPPENDEIRRVVRGGSWSDRDVFCRPEFRGQRLPGHRSANVGFRLALSRSSSSSRPSDRRGQKKRRPQKRLTIATDLSVAGIPTTEIDCVAYRVISSRFPPIHLFERTANVEDWEALYWLESLTNPRLRDEVGEIDLVPREDRVFGPGSSLIMAAFTHLNPDGSRFTDGTFGAFIAALSLDTAIQETIYHRELFLRITRQPPAELDMRVYKVQIRALLHDLRPEGVVDPAVFDPDSYAASQAIGRKLHAVGSEGVVYRSVRHAGGTCLAIYKPRLVQNMTQGVHLRYVWDGTSINQVYQLHLKNSD